jgi:acyl-CoA thioesterase-2
MAAWSHVPLKTRVKGRNHMTDEVAKSEAELQKERKIVVDEVLALLDLEPIEVNLFRGVSPQDRWQRVFGGQVIGQALVAAGRTVEDRAAHSLHAYFLRPGDPKVPIIYEVDRIRDGRSFTTRRVVAIQHGRAIFSMAVSFQIDEPGMEHQIDMVQVPEPEKLKSEMELRRAHVDKIPEKYRKHFLREQPIEMRPVNPRNMFDPQPGEPVQQVWFRATAPVSKNQLVQQCVLAYASDMTLLDTCLLPHGVSWENSNLQSASLDHAMWFHHPFEVDEWLLYSQDSPAASGARGFNRGSIYTRQGKLVASVAQEGLVRLHDEEKQDK